MIESSKQIQTVTSQVGAIQSEYSRSIHRTLTIDYPTKDGSTDVVAHSLLSGPWMNSRNNVVA